MTRVSGENHLHVSPPADRAVPGAVDVLHRFLGDRADDERLPVELPAPDDLQRLVPDQSTLPAVHRRPPWLEQLQQLERGDFVSYLVLRVGNFLSRFGPHAFHVPGRTAEQLRQQGAEDDGLGEALVGDGNGRTLYDGVPEVGGAGRKGVVDEDGLSAGTFTEERHLCGDEKKGFCQPCNKGTYCFCQICNTETRFCQTCSMVTCFYQLCESETPFPLAVRNGFAECIQFPFLSLGSVTR